MSRQRININRERRSLRAAAPNGADSALYVRIVFATPKTAIGEVDIFGVLSVR